MVYSAFAVALYAFRGSDPFTANGTTFGGTVVAYFVGGAGAGAVLGLLRPLARSRWGAAVVGFFCALPVWLGAAFAIDGVAALHAEDLLLTLLFSVLSGPICGVIAWERVKR